MPRLARPALLVAFELGVFVFIAFGALMIAAIALGFWLQHKRREAFRALATRLGLAYEPRPRDNLARRHRSLDACSGGSNPRTLNLLTGTYKGRQMTCFDFLATVQRGKQTSNITRGVMLTPVPPNFPRVSIVPEHFGHKLIDALGMEDIDFESTEFSDAYWVTSKDRRFAYDLVHPRMMEFLLDARKTRWEIRDGLLCHWHEGALKPAQIEAGLDRLVRFLDNVPRHLLSDAAARAGGPA